MATSTNAVATKVNYVITLCKGKEYYEVTKNADEVKDFIKDLVLCNMESEAAREALTFIYTILRVDARDEVIKTTNVKKDVLAFYNDCRKEVIASCEENISRVTGNTLRHGMTGQLLGYFEFMEVDGGHSVRIYGANGYFYNECTFTSWEDLLPLWNVTDIDVCVRYKK